VSARVRGSSNTRSNTKVLEEVLEWNGEKGKETAASAHSGCSSRLLTPPPLRVIGVSKTPEWAEAAVRGDQGRYGGGPGVFGVGCLWKETGEEKL
jgi:hypothetical protein